MFNINLPEINNESLNGANGKKILEYLFSLSQQLRYMTIGVEDLDKDLQEIVENTDAGVQKFARAIKSVNGSVSKIIQTAAEISSTVTANANIHSSQITQLADSIASRVTQTVFDAAMADKADTDTMDARLESIIAQTAEDIIQTFAIVQGNISDVSGEFDSFREEISTYIRTSIDGLDIGKSDSPFTMNLSNTQLSFLMGAIVLAYFANNKMYVEEIEVNKATIANFEWAETAGGTGLKWRG